MAKKKFIDEENQFLSNDSDFTDEDFDASEELEDELAAEEKPQLPKSISAPANDPTRMDSATPQEQKDAQEPGVITETTTLFDGNNIVRKKIRTT